MTRGEAWAWRVGSVAAAVLAVEGIHRYGPRLEAWLLTVLRGPEDT